MSNIMDSPEISWAPKGLDGHTSLTSLILLTPCPEDSGWPHGACQLSHGPGITVLGLPLHLNLCPHQLPPVTSSGTLTMPHCTNLTLSPRPLPSQGFTATETASSPMASPGLSEGYASSALHDSSIPSKPLPCGRFLPRRGRFLHIAKFSINLRNSLDHIWTTTSVHWPCGNAPQMILSQGYWSPIHHS